MNSDHDFQRADTWVRYVVPPNANASSDAEQPVTVFAPPDESAKAAITASIVAFLGRAGIGP